MYRELSTDPRGHCLKLILAGLIILLLPLETTARKGFYERTISGPVTLTQSSPAESPLTGVVSGEPFVTHKHLPLSQATPRTTSSKTLFAEAKPQDSDEESIGITRPRTNLLVTTTIMSVFPYRTAFFGRAKDPGLIFLSVVGIGGAGFVVPYLLTGDQEISPGMSKLAIRGSIGGFFHGIGLHLITSGGTNKLYQSGIVGSLASMVETYGGYKYAEMHNLSGGEAAHLGNLTAYMGPITGMFAAGALRTAPVDEAFNARPEGLGIIGGAGLGWLAGHYMINNSTYSVGDAYVASVLPIMSLLGIFSLTVGEDPYRILDRNGINWLGAGSMAAGTYLGHILTKPYNFTKKDATYMTVGAFGGFLLGLGLGSTLAAPDDFRTPILVANLGQIVGFGALYRLAAKRQTRVTMH